MACKKQPVALNLGTIDASRYVAIGTDATAGYSDDALHYEGQINSYANIIAEQMSSSDYVVPFNQPLMGAGSVGINLDDDSKLVLDLKADCKDTISLSPVRLAAQGDVNAWSQNTYSTAPFDNLGVPGSELFRCANCGVW